MNRAFARDAPTTSDRAETDERKDAKSRSDSESILRLDLSRLEFSSLHCDGAGLAAFRYPRFVFLARHEAQ
jgi:hypothetical protein